MLPQGGWRTGRRTLKTASGPEHSCALLKYDFHNSAGYWIFSTAHEMSQRMNDELAELGITFRQWEVLA